MTHRLLFVALLLLSPTFLSAQSTEDTYAMATVTAILSEMQDEVVGFERTVQEIEIQIGSGLMAGETVRLENAILGDRADMRLSVGDQVVIEQLTKVDGTTELLIREQYRLPWVALVAVAFVVLAIVFAGWTGATSLIGLIISIAILGLFVVPGIARGWNPLLVSFVGSVAIACTSLYFAHGFRWTTTVALLSTLLTLCLSLLLSVIAVSLTRIFGMGNEATMFLQLGPLSGIDLRGLLLGGIVIGALGVLDDITTTQTAAITELKRANPRMTKRALYRSGLTIGREHIASLVNTLALAYAGASLPLLLLFWTGPDAPWWVILNNEPIVEEIVRTLVGSMTLTLAVPISTWCACRYVKGDASMIGHIHVH